MSGIATGEPSEPGPRVRFHKDELKDLRFDYVLANPPFNVSDWGGDRLREDARIQQIIREKLPK